MGRILSTSEISSTLVAEKVVLFSHFSQKTSDLNLNKNLSLKVTVCYSVFIKMFIKMSLVNKNTLINTNYFI